MFIPFEEWMPDRASLGTGSIRALNVLPTAEGFETAPGFLPATTLPSPPGNVLDIQAFDTSAGTTATVAFCREKIWVLTGTSWFDVTRESASIKDPYTTDPEVGFWSFAKWGDILYATNYKDPIQKFDLVAGTPCVDIDGNLPGGFRARHLIIVGDFLVAFDTNDDSGSNAAPYRMHWSGRLRPEDFLPSLEFQSGYRDIIDIGNIVRPIGGQYGFILGQTGSVRIDYAGPPLVWQLTGLDEDIGCLYRRSVVKVANSIFWYSPRGWRKSGGGPSVAIGTGKVDSYFRKRVDPRSTNRMSTAIFRDRSVILFSYVSVDSVDSWPDEAVFLNFDTNKFTEGRYSVKFFGQMAKPPLLTDDAVWGELLSDASDDLVDNEESERPEVIAVGVDNSLLTTSGVAPDVYMETKEVQFFPGKKARVLRVRLVAEGDDPNYSVRISTRDTVPATQPASDPWIIPERTGACAADRRGRYHRFGVRLPGRFSSILGLDIDAFLVGR